VDPKKLYVEYYAKLHVERKITKGAPKGAPLFLQQTPNTQSELIAKHDIPANRQQVVNGQYTR
jgi:hypothetical protein